ncbi:MAG TPA: hypothetical protein PLP29_08720 [Candidatus Ozemobacteraceae bacterium]|nr:hypothetical protein [Candidatus Ozemobacteraceae bacterium]
MKKHIIACLLALSFPVSLSAQILDSVPDYEGQEIGASECDVRETDVARTGMCLSGTSGLMAVPTPDFQKDRKVLMSYKGGVSERTLATTAGDFDLEKNERWISAAYSVKPNLEISVNHLDYERSSSPFLANLNYREDATGFGMKYSTHIASQDLCFGGVFAPMEASEINAADLVQIEYLRSVYLTMGESLTDTLKGYLNLKHCFTDDQTVNLPFGRKLEFDRKEFLVSAIALEYAPTKSFSLMLESQFMNYRDFFTDGGDRVSMNVGIRGGSDALQGEVMVLSLNDDPDVRFGVNVGF